MSKAILKYKFFQIMMILCLFLTNGAWADENAKILATGDSFVIKTDEIGLLRSRMKSFFNTTEKEYCKALIKIKLFSMEAKEEKIDIEPAIAAELSQMIEQKLSGIYVDRLTKNYKLLPGTVYSYYLSHPDDFVDKEGNPINLNDDLRKKIKKQIMKKKVSEITDKEVERLIKKYNVTIVNPICIEEGSTK